MFVVLVALVVIACIFLVLFVLVQNPKGGGLGSGFGSSNVVGGVQQTTDFLEKGTWVLITAIFVLTIMSSAFLDKTSVDKTNTPTDDTGKTRIEELINEGEGE